MALITDLSVRGFDKVISQFAKLESDLPKFTDKFLNASLDYLVERAILHLSETTGQGTYPLTDTLVNSFRAYREPNLAILRNEAFHAAAVEFGTGIVGKKAPHEWAADFGIVYDANMHGEDGWVYKGDDGKFYHTTGMEAHRYMYNALMDYLYQGGKEQCIKIAWGEV